MSERRSLRDFVTRLRIVYRREGIRGVASKIRRRARIATRQPVGFRPEMLSEDNRFAVDPFLDTSREDLAHNRDVVAAWRTRRERKIRSATWLVPYFSHAYFGGVYTIFRFIEGFQQRGVENRVLIYDVSPEQYSVELMKSRMVEAFPTLAGVDLRVGMPGTGADRLADLESDIGIATLWTSAYALAKWRAVSGKYYFVQDFEPAFYAAGSAYALAEQTYRFGFEGIVNTPGLGDVYRSYGNNAVSFVPSVDSRWYHPEPDGPPEEPIRIVFYARPSTDRNAFGLGLAALMKVKEVHGDRVDIVCAGEEWSPKAYGVEGLVRCVGLLPGHEAVGALYRSSHIGLVFMLTKHPSYQPFEYMASGCATVTNLNESTQWFFEDGVNSLVAEPTATAVAQRINELVEQPELRARIAEGGARTVDATNWELEIERVWSFIEHGGGSVPTDGLTAAATGTP